MADIALRIIKDNLAMNFSVNSVPDKLLSWTRSLPAPLNDRAFYLLRRYFRAKKKSASAMTRIHFGNVAIIAPLNHPAVFWRYLPPKFNKNYVLVVRKILEERCGLIIDVGANIGDGIALLRSAGINAPVLAVEGTDIWYRLLDANVKGLEAVKLEHVFLGTGKEEGGLAAQVHDGSSRLVSGDHDIKTASLDDLLRSRQDQPIALLKTDTDGFDAKVLIGAEGLLKEKTPVLFVEVDEGLYREQGDSATTLVRYLLDCGYSSVAIWDNYGEWIGSRALSEGLSDLIVKYPGGPEKPYLDIAVFSDRDATILDRIVSEESRGTISGP